MLTLPAGTDILSTDTVTRIEDEAKKNLAKEEREFTQTVIHTNDKTIVVGLGGRYKTRRATKTPKKYSEYMESLNITEEKTKETDVNRTYFAQKCIVSLERLNLLDVIPLCLAHNMYDCECGGKSPFIVSAKPTTVTPSQQTESKVDILDKKMVAVKKNTKRKVEEPQIFNEQDNSINVSGQNKVNEAISPARPIRNIKKPKLKDDFTYSDEVSFYNSDCARVRGCPSIYLLNRRNVKRNKESLLKDDFLNNLTEADMLRYQLRESDDKQMYEVDLFKNQLIIEMKREKLSEFLNSCNNTSSYNESLTRKRKQTLEIRKDDINTKPTFNQDMAIQRRKKIAISTRKIIESVFDGEIIIDNRNMDLLKKMGPRTVSDGYARLLPWLALTENFRKGTIKIWCMIDQPSRLLINTSDKVPPKFYVNIRQTNQPTEVVSWILQNKLPSGYHEENVSFILKQTKDNYEICGLCTKNFNEEINKETANCRNESEDKLIPFKHKDLNGHQQILYMKKAKFKLQELVEESMASVGETSIDGEKLYMWAGLPEVYTVCKWRIIFLNSDFTYLYFTNLKYSIKYTDLLSVGDITKAANCTIMLRNDLIRQQYDHKAFGIYFDCTYQDRLFIGPYFKHFEGDDVETLRYINKSLVCTESFNKMQGKMNYKCGHWLIERPYNRKKSAVEQPDSTIDLTNDTDLTNHTGNDIIHKGKKRKSSIEKKQTVKKIKSDANNFEGKPITILYNNEIIQILDGVPRKPEDFNRYIITNIPHFGYLGAYQRDNKVEIDVSWPFENKMLRFPTVSCATDFLQERFSTLLQPIPESFKINIIVLTNLDIQNCKPINASILGGHYICGEFGYYNVRELTNDFCVQNLGITMEELLKIFAIKAQTYVRKKIEELADLLCIRKCDLGCYDMASILNLATKKITEQKELDRGYTAKKNALRLRKRELAIKVFNMISTLPDDQKFSENLKFRSVLSFKPRSKILSEPIEIEDSDDDGNNPNANKEQDNSTLTHNSDKSHYMADSSAPNNIDHDGSMPTLENENSASLMDPDNQPIPKPYEDKTGPKKLPPALLPLSALNMKNLEGSPMISILKDVESNHTSSTKVTNIATTSKFPAQKLKSILKPKLLSSLTDTQSSNLPAPSIIPIVTPVETQIGPSTPKKPQFLKGVKLVKAINGQLMLVSDKQKNKVLGTKVIIKDNKIFNAENKVLINDPEEEGKHFDINVTSENQIKRDETITVDANNEKVQLNINAPPEKQAELRNVNNHLKLNKVVSSDSSNKETQLNPVITPDSILKDWDLDNSDISNDA
ncbi:hypothetical protein NQ317_013187 [Molorchus minor]|uniref:Uncharacterized protein n=1 Tax=Molorchus minor TaxID=1323400 RepID=A0ABQ9J300_9CUCU|nr:hypothetical protein NQ317_013187 [Molorchus minor]